MDKYSKAKTLKKSQIMNCVLKKKKYIHFFYVNYHSCMWSLYLSKFETVALILSILMFYLQQMNDWKGKKHNYFENKQNVNPLKKYWTITFREMSATGGPFTSK